VSKFDISNGAKVTSDNGKENKNSSPYCTDLKVKIKGSGMNELK
jgi:hypothetical protein